MDAKQGIRIIQVTERRRRFRVMRAVMEPTGQKILMAV